MFSSLRIAPFILASVVATNSVHAQGVLIGRLTTTTTGLQLNSGAQQPSISPDGRYVALVSTSSNLGPPSSGALNVYRYDLVTDAYHLATSVLSGGNCFAPSISADGLALAFESNANNFGGGTPSGFVDVFYSEAFDAGQGEIAFNTYLVSRGLGGAAPNEGSRFASISGNGRFVAFHSDASNLVAGDSNGAPDIFVGDSLNLFGGAPQRISVDASGAQINGPSRALSPSAISSDGRFVAFAVDTPVSINGSNPGTLEDVFVRDRVAGTTSLMSKSSANVAGNGSSDKAAISPNGRFVVFRSFSSNLVASLTGSNIYVRDRQNNITINMPMPPGGINCEDPRIADTGDIVSQCAVSGSSFQQAFLYRPATDAFIRLSTSQTAGNGNNTSGNFTGISADGNFMVFDTSASDLVPSDTNNSPDVFLAIDANQFDQIFADGFE